MIQRSEEWFNARLGKVTASNIYKIFTGGAGKTRKDYLTKLVLERLTGLREDGYTSGSMQWGTDTEPLARSAYESIKGVWVKEVGFINHPNIEMFGVSPDGLPEPEGLLEIKCPNTATHLYTFEHDKIKKDYDYQMMGQMSCTGQPWCDFMSFDPRLPENLQVKIIRVERDIGKENEMLEGIKAFLLEVDAETKRLRNL